MERPAPLPISQKCIYKVVNGIPLAIDIYLPVIGDYARPIMLYIHGGGWLGGNRWDYCRPLFHHFLTLGFVVTAMDYRLLPETNMAGQLEDVRDVELWLRDCLPHLETTPQMVVDPAKIVVVGGSAGAHLALLTPKLWSIKPEAILSMYGPTNLHNVSTEATGYRELLPPIPEVPLLLAAATTFDAPPTESSSPQWLTDNNMTPRELMGRKIFAESVIAEFLIRGLPRGRNGQLALPARGSASPAEIDAISPLQLTRLVDYPPVYQVMGQMDQIFDNSHGHDFKTALDGKGVENKLISVPDKGHAFDIWEEIGSEIDRTYLAPAVRWVADQCLPLYGPHDFDNPDTQSPRFQIPHWINPNV